jgi:hypothetical protein
MIVVLDHTGMFIRFAGGAVLSQESGHGGRHHQLLLRLLVLLVLLLLPRSADAAGRECCRRSGDAHGRTPGVL